MTPLAHEITVFIRLLIGISAGLLTGILAAFLSRRIRESDWIWDIISVLFVGTGVVAVMMMIAIAKHWGLR